MECLNTNHSKWVINYDTLKYGPVSFRWSLSIIFLQLLINLKAVVYLTSNISTAFEPPTLNVMSEEKWPLESGLWHPEKNK